MREARGVESRRINRTRGEITRGTPQRDGGQDQKLIFFERLTASAQELTQNLRRSRIPVTSFKALMRPFLHAGLPASLFVCLLASLWAGGPLHAAEPPAPRASVAVASIEFDGNVPSAARASLLERLAEGLKQGEVTLWGQGEAAKTPCGDAPCYRRLAGELGVAYLVTGKVVESQKNYEIDLELIAGATGRSSGYHRQRCQICGLSEAAERMSLAASALTEKLKLLLREPGRLVVRARPTNAIVSVDGAVKGPVPQEVNLPAGVHRLTLESPGYRPVERELQIVPAVDQSLEIEMMQIPSEFPYKGAGWAAVTTGAALIAGGVVTMLFFNGSEVGCAPEDQDLEGDCPKLHANAWWASALFGAGAAAATLGGVWLYLGSQSAAGGSNNTSMNVGMRGRF